MRDSLRKIRDDAARWRRAHPGARRLPNEIRVRGVRLLDKHSHEEIAEATGMGGASTIRGWERQFRWHVNQHPEPPVAEGGLAAPEFVEVPLTAVPPRGEDPFELIVEGVRGCSLRLRGKVSPEVVRSLAHLVMHGVPA